MFKRWIEVDGKVVSVTEGNEDVLQQYYSIKNYYPIIEYQYVFGGQQFVGCCGKKYRRRYRLPEVDRWGSRRNDDEFFWRQLKRDDVIRISVNRFNPKESRLAVQPTETYRSERKALHIVVLLIAIVAALLLKLKSAG